MWLAAATTPVELAAVPDAGVRRRFRSTTYDARGVGATRSSAPPPWAIDEHAADCAALIEAACDPPVSLVGLSMGSLIAASSRTTGRTSSRARS